MRVLNFIILSQGFLYLWVHYRFQQVNVFDTANYKLLEN